MSAKAIHGRFGEVYVADDMIAEISAFTINETADTAEATAMGDIAASYRLGVTRGDGTITAYWDAVGDGHQDSLVVGDCTTLLLYPAGRAGGDLGCDATVSSKPEITAKCWITGKTMNVSMGDIVSCDFTFTLEGPLVEAPYVP